MLNVVARYFRDPTHHVIHLRNDLFQEIRLFTGDLFRDSVCERQDALQPSQKTQRHLVDLFLFFQELLGQILASSAYRHQSREPQT